MLLTSSWGREHQSSKTANSKQISCHSVNPNTPESPPWKARGSKAISATLTELLLHYHHLRCSPEIFLKSWIFWHLPYVFPVFVFGRGGKKEKHLQLSKCSLSNTWEETTADIWLSGFWLVKLFHNCQRFQIRQTDIIFITAQTTHHFLQKKINSVALHLTL